MQKERLRNYARLIARVGGNVQPGQDVFLTAEIDQPEFVQMLVEECYLCGARKVVLDWEWQPIQKLHYQYRDVETLSTVDPYEEARWAYVAAEVPCRITLISSDPAGMNDVDHEKVSAAQQRVWQIYKPYRDQIENRQQWCFACVPGPVWAGKLFPELAPEAAMEKLWELILATCRVGDPDDPRAADPITAWEAHNRELARRAAWLNALPKKELHFYSGNGTDFTIGMIPEALFKGVLETVKSGVTFTPNLPTEECLITPKKGVAEGIVYGTKPLCFHGQTAEDFWIRFHEGRAVAWDARVNRDLLTELINRDEGSAYLGECALVPFDSPVNRTGTLFYNTLIDENAACHLALGKGYINSIAGYHDRTLAECRALGVNDSQIHEDFMIGSADLAVDAILTDGSVVPVFRNGTWAFD
ncbi:MAG: aminopeptidase [Clostridia bacterium]|nr:aminopeptidase [Clostridia bacterium]